ncbi:NAD-dependent epimerase/dehydratase family protein [Sphingomonas sp. SORGH_AS_0879]|uniref:UDP-2-acetamido-2,6-beta-L-arabino-hexul-4-ose reductase n=1 Tax=Sphingomonas sp. SORGH_AS_0879 TaxID=3041790 RepID=UPI00277D3347|nr:NAD-dependent epimerase/dehydratase family protein [Sphingomonas sp. SORGH_AS_0879]MDQ1228591.1 UDP-2-acetamido-2,6-beta-L-arabino-hexul-4-ose reductase [Sphingomonas sp. SORGH_AS_0879]
MTMHTILVTGAEGFIGRNLTLRLTELGKRAIAITRASTPADLADGIAQADAVIHLAGANRPRDTAEFMAVNRDASVALADSIVSGGRALPVIVASSSRAGEDTDYGRSKLAGEQALATLGARIGAPVYIFRLPNIFGKWARPDYNSAIATFCHRTARGIPIEVHDPAARLSLVYVDDVVTAFLTILSDVPPAGQHQVAPAYDTTVGAVADTIRGFAAMRETGIIGHVGTGLERALYATYVSHLPPESFSYPITTHSDPRGAFAEMLKTIDSGQFSVFNAHPGVTRGGHYHHTKTEKFLIVHGRARFRFRHMITGEFHELDTSGDDLRIVETVPGWAHDVTNIGDELMISLLWANEIFDRQKPDTIAAAVSA